MVGLGRFELPTSPLSGVRSNQLSYRPVLAGSPASFLALAMSSAAPNIFKNPHSSFKKGFEDKVEHAGKLRIP